MCVNNLPKVVTRQCPGVESNLRLWVASGLQVRHITARLPSHTEQKVYMVHNKNHTTMSKGVKNTSYTMLIT